MAKLIDLFNEREPELYNYVKYPYKEDDDTQPYRYTTLDNAEPMDNTFFEDQSNPVSLSARRDFNRMFQFSKSAQGLVFLGKQTFLQTGNTFAQTRLYNPTNVVIHATPFVHLKRHIDIKQTIASIQGGSSTNYATLQKETYDPTAERARNRLTSFGGIENQLIIDGSGKSGITTQFSSGPTEFNLRKFGGGVKNKATGRLLDIVSSIKSTAVSGYNAQFNSPNETDWKKSRPELMLAGKDKPPVSYYDRLSGLAQTNTSENGMYSGVDEATGQSFKDLVNEYNNKQIIKTSVNDDGRIEKQPWNSRYYKDVIQTNSNIFVDNPDTTTNPTNDDTIDVIFRLPAYTIPDPEGLRYSQPSIVRFRAFLEDLSETVTPTYNENKYIGRYETFYTYDKVIRDVSFKLTLNAFSKEELGHIHHKMSFLTSLAYPEVTNNYLTPNIFKITIGKIFINQPCILQSLSHNIDNDVSWDISEQLPMTFASNIGIRLLDKKLHKNSDIDIYSFNGVV